MSGRSRRGVLDKLAGAPTIWEIWNTVTDENDSDVSYAAIRDYIRSRGLAKGERELAGRPGR